MSSRDKVVKNLLQEYHTGENSIFYRVLNLGLNCNREAILYEIDRVPDDTARETLHRYFSTMSRVFLPWADFESYKS
jgi:hypothetical protein